MKGNIYENIFPGCMTFKSCFVKSGKVPYPFSKLKIIKDKSSHGKSWLFHIDETCLLKGCLFPGGYRLCGIKEKLSPTDLFFIENRNILKFHHGLLAAIIPQNPNHGLNKCELIFLRNISSSQTGELSASFIIFKKKNDQEISCKSEYFPSTKFDFELKHQIINDTFKVRFMNKIEFQCDNNKIMEMKTNGPDVWVVPKQFQVSRYQMITQFNSGISFVKKRTRKNKFCCPRRSNNSKGRTPVLFVASDDKSFNNSSASSEKYYLLPYDIKTDRVLFCKVLPSQYKSMIKMDKILKGFSLETYMGKLRGFNVMNNSIFVEALLFNLGNYNSGFIVCKTKKLSTLDGRVNTSQTGIDNVCVGFLDHNPSDFDLPKGSVGIFRSYPWPFSNNLKDYYLDICGKTFAGKGLIRNCTNHSGNFEMLGLRRSKQSNGSMLCSQDRVDQHHYYRELINLLLLPEAKRIVNFLMEEAISAGSTSGESLMLLYRQILNFKNEKQLCFNSIITQKNSVIPYIETTIRFLEMKTKKKF